jgi:succinate dehydrogenase / fumarate reductase, cytochrome b subunit
MSWTICKSVPSVVDMALATPTRARSSVGLKAIMAVSGAVLGLFVVIHMAGNLKFFAGPVAFDGYAVWLRRIGEPVLGPGWYLWAQRAVLLACLIAHVAAATALARRARAARPVRYRHRVRGAAVPRIMRWGGVLIAIFVAYHILDLTVGVANPDFRAGEVYHNVVADFRHWYVTVVYTVAVLAVGLHLRHGLWSAARSLGATGSRNLATVVATLVTVGFLAVPLSVQIGLLR